MAWLRVRLAEEQQRIVNEERSSHPNPRIREKMLVLWLLHHGVKRQDAAKIVGVGRATVQRYVAAFREGGLDQGLRITIGCSGHLGRLCVFILYCMQGPSKTWRVRFL